MLKIKEKSDRARIRLLLFFLATVLVVTTATAVTYSVLNNAVGGYAWVIEHPAERRFLLNSAAIAFSDARLASARAVIGSTEECIMEREFVVQREYYYLQMATERVFYYTGKFRELLSNDPHLQTAELRPNYYMQRDRILTIEGYLSMYLYCYMGDLFHYARAGDTDCAVYIITRSKYIVERFTSYVHDTMVTINSTLERRVDYAERTGDIASVATILSGLGILILAILLGAIFIRDVSSSIEGVKKITEDYNEECRQKLECCKAAAPAAAAQENQPAELP